MPSCLHHRLSSVSLISSPALLLLDVSFAVVTFHLSRALRNSHYLGLHPFFHLFFDKNTTNETDSFLDIYLFSKQKNHDLDISISSVVRTSFPLYSPRTCDVHLQVCSLIKYFGTYFGSAREDLIDSKTWSCEAF